MPTLRLFAGRFILAAWVLGIFMALNTAIRLGLLAFNGDGSLWLPQTLAPILAIGFFFDLVTGVWWLVPFALLAACWPDRAGGRRPFTAIAAALLLLVFGVFGFIAVAEFVFWNEFGSRFNFIAVDYLIYTREVIGNIRESYDLRPLLAGIALAALAMLALCRPALRRAAAAPAMAWPGRIGRALVFLALPGVSWLIADDRLKEFTDNFQAGQLAGNGQYEFCHAFRHNEIDYAQFYRTEPLARAYELVREEFDHIGPTHFTGSSKLPIERQVDGKGPERRLNVVLISVESLSAEFLGAFGNRQGLTPRLDRLAETGMLFTNLYATGTRTVRGLEAISLSIPPTPGHSIIKRPDNDRLYTLGEVFSEKGYEPLYLYGGYGYFDNMNAFFGGNGYTVIDRGAIAKDAIHYENIWGVADEDLYSLALAQLSERHAAGKRFFAHIMTTSNHRPFTYPEGRIDIPPGTSRAGAVKYTDWALGDFIERARRQPWFDDTVFVILADHTASGRGKTDLPIENFHIPLIFYAPKLIEPQRIDTLASQIDVGPTLLALLNFSYRSHFFGQDIIREGPKHQRAFLANYQTVGYMEDGILVELRPQRRWRLLDIASGREHPLDRHGQEMLDEAVGYYQAAAAAYRSGALRQEGMAPP